MQDQSHRTGSLAFTRDWYIYEKVDVNKRVTVLGYPGEFRDQSTLYPVEREARISTPYGRDFDGEPVFVMDARMHPGTSGSPVIMRIGRLRAIDPAYPDHRRKPAYLLGIHSATYYSDVEPPEGEDRMWAAYESAQEGEDGGVMRYDLNKAWYPELLDDIFDRLD